MPLLLQERERTADLVILHARLHPLARAVDLRYRTRTGAVLRVNGRVAGAFDLQHDRVTLPPSDREREIVLEVERFSLLTSMLPAGPGPRWEILKRIARQEPRRSLEVLAPQPASAAAGGDAILWGHAHLDVAWLWNFTQARRKAVRTFANAVQLAQYDPAYVFMQSQPQLYEFVREAAPELDAAVVQLARDGRFDPDVAALWVEPDANVPCGESLLMQMLHAHRYVTERFGMEPRIAWLPDTFGFPRTLPTLLAHAGIPYFASTKLQWNDTSHFPHPQFRWRGPDGAEVTGAMLLSYGGPPTPRRAKAARERAEPLVVGYGDGGGGPTRKDVREGARIGAWERPRAWFERVAQRALPVHDDELYLEYHRGTYTTHHDVKARNAALERRLLAAQEQLAWCVAVRAQPEILARLRAGLDEAWRAVLCNQFHDILAGAATTDAYAEVHALYDRAEEALVLVEQAAAAMLPRGRAAEEEPAVAPARDADGRLVFENGLVRAVVDERGVLHELATASGRSIVSQANLLVAYRDTPRRWDAWNIDRGYERRRVPVRPQGMERYDDGAEFRFLAGASPLAMRVELRRGEPFVRVQAAVDWRERHVLLRVEQWLAARTDRVTYGAPHGTVTRTPSPAQFEVPGQRFARVEDDRGGLALFALDTYGWSARRLKSGGMRLGHSLLRAPMWPDPQADRGTSTLSWAFAPFDAGVGIGPLERAWEAFAFPPRVRLFTSGDSAVLVVACKPAADGNGAIVRVRECEGRERPLRLRCAARMRGVEAVDGLERACAGAAAIEGEEIVASIGAYGLRSFRVRF
jgi:alpha-mannosidase